MPNPRLNLLRCSPCPTGAGELPSADVATLADFVDTILAGMPARARDGARRDQLDNAARIALLAIPGANGLFGARRNLS